MVEVYLDGVLKERNITEQDRQLLIDYLQCICFGFVIGWLESGMKEGIRERFASQRIGSAMRHPPLQHLLHLFYLFPPIQSRVEPHKSGNKKSPLRVEPQRTAAAVEWQQK